MASETTPPLKTIWVWPTGMYPRRVIYYLKAKSLPIHLLHGPDNPSGQLQINALVLSMAAGGFVPSQEGTEDRPAGHSLPVLRIAGGNQDQLIRQSSSILEYLEDLYPSSQGYSDLSGGGIEGRAGVRDIVQMINEVIPFTAIDFRHTNQTMLAFSGLTKEQMMPIAGEDARKLWKWLFTKLEDWVRPHIMDNGALSLAGVRDTPTLADFSLAASVTYYREMFGTDILEGFDVLNTWFERFAKSPFFVDRSELERIEKEGFSSLFKD